MTTVDQTCCIKDCENHCAVGQSACKAHWDQYTQISNQLMTELKEHQDKEGIGQDINWNDIVAQYVIPMNVQFNVGKVKFEVVGIKERKLTIMPVSKLMSLKKAEKGERYARLRELSDQD